MLGLRAAEAWPGKSRWQGLVPVTILNEICHPVCRSMVTLARFFEGVVASGSHLSSLSLLIEPVGSPHNKDGPHSPK